MIKIDYDVCINTPPAETQKFVTPIFDGAYVVRKASSEVHLHLPNHEDNHRNWLMSAITIDSFDKEHQFLLSNVSEQSPLMTRQVINNQTVITNEVYEAYLKQLFAAIRCGWENAEMLIKLYGHFTSVAWGEAKYLLGGVIPTPLFNVLTCKIEPMYATIQSILPPFEVKRKKHLDVKTWKPKDSMNYQVVWHLMVTLSNGEKHKMYYPVCSVNKWYDTMQHYFVAHPTERFSPIHYTCNVTNHPNAYRYEEIMERLKFYSDLTVGTSAAEILIKLSAFFNFPDRATHLQTILTGEEVELVFSGKVLWKEGYLND